MNAVVDREKVVNLNNNSGGSGEVKSTSDVTSEEEEEFFDAVEEQEPVSNVEEGNDLGLATSEEEEEFFDAVEEQEPLANFNVPLSIFHYKDYNSDFFTSWYNISSRIFKEVNRACPEKKVLNLALSVLMFPYIVFTALGLAVYNKLKTNDKTQISSEENKTKKSKVSESTAKRLAYGILAAVAILVSIPTLLLLLIPATPALAIFYLLNRKLSHSLIDVLKISSGLYQNKHQNIEVSFHETEVSGPSIAYDMEMKFPPQFERLLRDLYKNENNKWFDVTRDSEHNIVLKLSTNINLKNGLKPLHNEIKNVLATSIQEFAKTMEELIKLEKKEITYDKLKELLNEFKSKVVDSIGPNLTSHLIQSAYQVAFIQAIKFQRDRQEEDFSLEDEIRNTLVRQELENQGKELPSEKEMIIKDLKELLLGDDIMELLDNADDISDDVLLVLKARWKQFIEEDDIAERKVIDICKDIYPKETEEALNNAKERIKDLKKEGEERYVRIHGELKNIYDEGKNNLINNDLKRKLEDLFKFEYDNQEVEQRLVKSVIKRAESKLSQSDIPDKEKQSLGKQLKDLEKEASAKINDFVEKMYLEVTKCKMLNLFRGQAKSMKGLCDLLKEDAPSLIERIGAHRAEIAKCLEQPTLLREIIERNEDLNKYLEDEQNRKGADTELIQKHLKNNQEILKALKQLELEEKGLLINEETTNDYREELESREKTKFAIIEDDLLKEFERETFNEEAVKKLLEEAELEYYLAEKCIKGPVIKTKDNIKHFCQDLLSPLIDNLTKDVINNIPGNSEGYIQKVKNWSKVTFGTIKIGVSNAYKETTERKALNVAHNTYKQGETFLQHFYSSYKGVGAFLDNLFSDEGETFKDDVWPKVEEHLHGMWDRFFKDIEFKIGNKLDEVNMTQQRQETVIAA
ncbi:hypothetical protein HCR18_06655 [Wolbachia pipientis]|uniref:hypothetical protein n=1 Tax=Wolbachia pipientis TaxID=955 RepID=UPI0015FAC777|nr:hypothetical protein [Wolbachia pipientis]MBA8758662.1 hypothetical protein [Wolbachia pipientis]